MATVWVIWTERYNRIFNHKALSFMDLFDYILHFVDFWAGHLVLPIKRKVDAPILTYASTRWKVQGEGVTALAPYWCSYLE